MRFIKCCWNNKQDSWLQSDSAGINFHRTAWVQKIKGASEQYIETEKKKREKAYQGTKCGRCPKRVQGSRVPGRISGSSLEEAASKVVELMSLFQMINS